MAGEMTARTEIEDFIVSYAHDIDDGAVERWPGYFAEDGIYQIITRETFEAGLPLGIMYCEGRGMMSDRVKAMQTANIYEAHTYCHMLGRSQIGSGDNGRYGVRTNFNIVRTMQDGGSKMFAVGKYLDVIEIQDGRPLFKERRVVLESRRVDILLVYPL
ncbi:MAG: aromatic-ring-hydroxylating dioxygenase subunit beta [Rhodospirillaceae bacterium]|jgi:anthranilate 1,2-dioxygenase small subunit|nr:aromatic-ring-hydroxylating dioxygenase subunit beta [Rhodospirillaceae bacterium]MBT5192625.1 aromatic-ring-hydroxylating dioxygenase subunit beta [Rhodospirillaceae bacterium]MBT5899319.1 aromatic-ring-hydroxylating dioxygenase subunit beta [Rhodospirillaceae bacterium]MBT7761083.1 aromatic-ring-hydroxylating dioxygenase subunit beta [Rhodospirillaceae bacterium]